MWNEVIQRLVQESLSESELSALTHAPQLALSDLCDGVAREVAEGYLQGTYTWEHCDLAMNNLFASAYAVGTFGLPTFAWRVFEAFDEGEYIHTDSAEPDGKPRTKALLLEFLTP